MIIVFEGADGSGKGTQSKMLYDYLKRKGVNCELISFPYYASETGKKIRDYLKGEYKLSVVDFAHLQYENKLELKPRMKELLKKDYVIILDRYCLSNLVYNAARAEDSKKTELINTIKEWQKNLIKKDLGFFLDLPVSISYERIEERGTGRDLLESDKEYQEKVYKLYKELSMKESYHHIKCADEDGKQRTRESIFKEILEIVKLKTSLTS